jgi:uncharacterized membrane protein YphA (DoxX/SURF4 family)
MHGLAYATALVLAAVFAAAAIAKLRDREGTRATFTAFGLPQPLATAVPVVELAVAVGLVVAPGWAAVVSLVVLAAFTTFIARAVRLGVRAPCNCFGRASDRPVSSVEIGRNGLLAVASVVAMTAPGPTSPDPSSVLVVAAATLCSRWVLHQLDERHPA